MPVFFAEEGEEINFVFEPHPARDLANALVVPFQFVCAIEILTWTINWWTGMEGKARKSLLSLLPLTKNRAAISEMRRGEPRSSLHSKPKQERFCMIQGRVCAFLQFTKGGFCGIMMGEKNPDRSVGYENGICALQR